jgi:hypothetical protein
MRKKQMTQTETTMTREQEREMMADASFAEPPMLMQFRSEREASGATVVIGVFHRKSHNDSIIKAVRCIQQGGQWRPVSGDTLGRIYQPSGTTNYVFAVVQPGNTQEIVGTYPTIGQAEQAAMRGTLADWPIL